MKKNVAALRLVEREEAVEVPELSHELRTTMAEIGEAVREGLLAMSVGVGFRVLAEMMEEELTTKVGPRHAKLAGRRASRHGSAPGSVVLGGRSSGSSDHGPAPWQEKRSSSRPTQPSPPPTCWPRW